LKKCEVNLIFVYIPYIKWRQISFIAFYPWLILRLLVMPISAVTFKRLQFQSG